MPPQDLRPPHGLLPLTRRLFWAALYKHRSRCGKRPTPLTKQRPGGVSAAGGASPMLGYPGVEGSPPGFSVMPKDSSHRPGLSERSQGST
ncbi:hypothetical protein SKAU_G00048280 [Synaphobranchus kaupii]|uniref:Uncharacterized protein n=1 Tax=Synaphobranchus kaupii TaxID=118154 RepID=A0A9Q1G3B4_SYNKA|nr:hypothetical protein SKAU_G00048280 [Synaphobranchus kaupii]